jgi:Ca-activated chloride channel family protein
MRALAAVSIVLGVMSASAQQPAFKSGVDLVRIPVNVMRSGEAVVNGLSASDFTLREDGVVQSITLFERETLPLSLCIVLDVSGSMSQGPAELAGAAIRNVTSLLDESDELAILTFAQTSELLVPWSAPAAAARLSLRAEILGSTSLHDATRAAFGLLESARNPRQIVLLITDGFDTSSRTRLRDVVKSRRQSEALVYAFAVGANSGVIPIDRFGADPYSEKPATPSFMSAPRPDSVTMVSELVGDSGGTTYPMATAGDPPRIARRFINELRYQYTLGYTPAKSFDGKYRRVKVDVKKGGYQIRHRGGYLAMPSPTPSPKPQDP